MKQVIANKYFLFLCRIVIGFIFVYAGAEKLNDPLSFSDSILNYKLFSATFANISAILVPWIEVTTGLLIILGISVKENAAIISSFLLFFIVIIAISIMRGLNIDCGCFGAGSSHEVGISKIVENTILLLLGINLIIFGSDYLSITSKTN